MNVSRVVVYLGGASVDSDVALGFLKTAAAESIRNPELPCNLCSNDPTFPGFGLSKKSSLPGIWKSSAVKIQCPGPIGLPTWTSLTFTLRPGCLTAVRGMDSLAKIYYACYSTPRFTNAQTLVTKCSECSVSFMKRVSALTTGFLLRVYTPESLHILSRIVLPSRFSHLLGPARKSSIYLPGSPIGLSSWSSNFQKSFLALRKSWI